MRYLGVILIAILTALWCGCPQPLQQQKAGPGGAVVQPAADDGSPDEGVAADDGPAAGQGADDLAADDTPDDPAEEAPDEPAAGDDATESESVEDDETVDPDAAEDEAGAVEAEDFDAEYEEYVEPDGGAVETALDPERLLYELDDEANTYEHQTARVSADSVAFAGRWTMVVLTNGGRARQAEYADEWVFELSDDGSCTVSQHADGDTLEQSGGWELSGGALTLLMGPGGQRTFIVERWRDDVATLTDVQSGAVLFCLREEPGAAAPRVARSYQTNFGGLKLRKSGQAYFTGSYGEPEGKVVLRQAGRFLVGSWEQPPEQGFVILELTDAGLDGWWWYEDSTKFDGEWTVPDAD